MVDEFSPYEEGLNQLREALSSHDASRNNFPLFEARLRENITFARAHGDTETLRHERSRVIGALNAIAENTHGVPFVDLCPGLFRPGNAKDSFAWMLSTQGDGRKPWHKYLTDCPPLVGRRDKLGQLHEHLQRCIREQRPDLVLLRGVPGIGKTRLLAEFCEQVESEGIGVCGFVQLLGSDVDRINTLCLLGQIWYSPTFEEAKEVVVNRIPERAETIENLIHRLCNGFEPTPTPKWDSVQNHSPFHVAWGVLGRLAQGKPVILALDDLQEADSNIIEFLRWENLSFTTGPILIVGSFISGAERASITSFAQTRLPSPVHSLPPLSRSDTISLVRSSIAGEPLPYDLCQLIYRKSGGNPYFALQLTKALEERELICRKPDNGWNCRAELTELDDMLPETLDELACFRCATLEDLGLEGKMDAHRAAIIGQQFWFRVLHKISPDGPTGELRLGRVLKAMTDQQLISHLKWPDALPTDRGYCFDSPIYWQSLYENADLPVNALHGQIAELLGELYEDPEAKRKLYFWRAWHYERAGKIKKALEVLELAGMEAEQGARLHQALWFVDRMLDHFHRQPKLLSTKQRIDLLSRAAKLYAQLGWLEKAITYYDQALGLSRGWRWRRCRIDLMINTAWVKVKQGHFESASQLLERALTHCTYTTPAYVRSSVYRHLCAFHLERLSVQVNPETQEQDIRLAYQYAQKSKEYLERCKNPETRERQADLALVLNNFGRTCFFANRPDDAQVAYEESLQIADRLGDRALAAYVLNNLGGLEAKLDNSFDAIRYFKESLTITDKEDNLFLRCKSLLNLGTTYANLQSDEAEQCLEEAHWIACILGNHYLLFDTCINLALYYNNNENWEQAGKFLSEANQARPGNPLVNKMLSK